MHFFIDLMSKTAENRNVNPKGFIMESSEQKKLPEDILETILNSYEKSSIIFLSL